MSDFKARLLLGNCLEKLAKLDDNSVDSVVTDPPYGLSFMGKKWDYDVPSVEIWREVLRVLKPGGFLLSFGGTRTYHRMVVNIEDAGFEIRDQLQWIYGSGFPKSMDISKAIDKAAGAEREVIGINPSSRPNSKVVGNKGFDSGLGAGDSAGLQTITAPATPKAIKWQGYGTALKPANEPIVLARKPLSETTVAKNVLKHGVGGLNIDGSRIGTDDKLVRPEIQRFDNLAYGKGLGAGTQTEPQGRWPSNVLLDETAAEMLDAQTKDQRAAKPSKTGSKFKTNNLTSYVGSSDIKSSYDDSGGASRFFYVAKASKRERGEGNVHPTVKPLKLMEYLIKLVTPEGGTVLDPFMGSGTTGIAATTLAFKFVGMEMTPEYFEIAKKRIGNVIKPEGESNETNQEAI